jgi:hypothetical protein
MRSPSGREQADHPTWLHDDLANSTALAVCSVYKDISRHPTPGADGGEDARHHEKAPEANGPRSDQGIQPGIRPGGQPHDLAIRSEEAEAIQAARE